MLLHTLGLSVESLCSLSCLFTFSLPTAGAYFGLSVRLIPKVVTVSCLCISRTSSALYYAFIVVTILFDTSSSWWIHAIVIVNVTGTAISAHVLDFTLLYDIYS